nr:glucosidase 2 subunit beta-like [Aegilops tauschii subsp. strangulata]
MSLLQDYHNLCATAFNSKVQELDQCIVDLSESRKANATLQQRLGEANTALCAKEADCNKLAEERDRLVTQLAEQAELLKKAQKDAEDKETGLLAEFAAERSAWTDKEAMLTASLAEVEDMVDDFFPGHSGAANQAIEADREGRRAEGEQIAADAPPHFCIFVPELAENGAEAPPEWFGLDPEDGEDSDEVIDSNDEGEDEEDEEGEEEAPEVGADDQPQFDRASSNEPRPSEPAAAEGDQAETDQPASQPAGTTDSTIPPTPSAAS